MKVRLLKASANHKEGTVLNIEPYYANRLIADGSCEKYTEAKAEVNTSEEVEEEKPLVESEPKKRRGNPNFGKKN